MDERLFARLSALLDDQPVVLASVLGTRGATPRKSGSRMLVTATDSAFSVGGGLAEARVLDAARRLLQDAGGRAEVDIDLTGRVGAAGICGGRMRIALRRWHGTGDRARAAEVERRLHAGEEVRLSAAELGADSGATTEGTDEPTASDAAVTVAALLRPDPRLLIVGAGHCGLALYELARHLDFDLWVQDARAACFARGSFAAATCLHGDAADLQRARDTARALYVVLLNRDFAADVAALEVLCSDATARTGAALRHADFLGMMGSHKRIAEVLAALPRHAGALQALHAPVGIDLGAETPHEIAVSILAQLVQVRAQRRSPMLLP